MDKISETATFHFDEEQVYMKSGLLRVDPSIVACLHEANKIFDKGIMNSEKELKQRMVFYKTMSRIVFQLNPNYAIFFDQIIQDKISYILPLYESMFQGYIVLMTDINGIFYSTSGDSQYNAIFNIFKPHLHQSFELFELCL